MTDTDIDGLENTAKEYSELMQVLEEDTEWVCAYCGNSAEGADDPSVFRCCGEYGHVELVNRHTREPILEAE